jgi:hypothetical protein
MLDRLVRYMREQDGVTFTTMIDVANALRQAAGKP